MTARATVQVSLLLAAAAALAVAAAQPLAFQKYNTLRPAPPGAAVPPLEPSGEAVPIQRLVAAIPYQAGAPEVLAVHPETKHRKTIVEGRGDCSEKSFGLAWQLEDPPVDYQVIHFLRPDGFTKGDGHTVLRLRYAYRGAERVGLVDLLAGGLPRGHDGLLDVGDLAGGPIPDFSIVPLNDRVEGVSPFYGEYLEDVVVGYVPRAEVSRYFRFLEAVYLPLGSERLEKYLYDGLALVFGFLPAVYVPDYERLVGSRALERRLHRTALWVIRGALVAVPLMLVAEIRRRAHPPSGRS